MFFCYDVTNLVIKSNRCYNLTTHKRRQNDTLMFLLVYMNDVRGHDQPTFNDIPAYDPLVSLQNSLRSEMFVSFSYVKILVMYKNVLKLLKNCNLYNLYCVKYRNF